MIYPAIIVAVFCTLTNSISALQCYSCKGTGDDPCVQNPEAAAVATCSNYEACYMARREIRGPSDAASSVSIIRGCGQSPPAVASSTNGYSVSVNSQSCTTDLCNVGTGQQTFNINDFINNFQIPNINYDVNGGYKPAGYPLGYPTGYPTGYPNYPNYPTNDYPGSLLPFLIIFFTILEYLLNVFQEMSFMLKIKAIRGNILTTPAIPTIRTSSTATVHQVSIQLTFLDFLICF